MSGSPVGASFLKTIFKKMNRLIYRWFRVPARFLSAIEMKLRLPTLAILKSFSQIWFSQTLVMLWRCFVTTTRAEQFDPYQSKSCMCILSGGVPGWNVKFKTKEYLSPWLKSFQKTFHQQLCVILTSALPGFTPSTLHCYCNYLLLCLSFHPVVVILICSSWQLLHGNPPRPCEGPVTCPGCIPGCWEHLQAYGIDEGIEGEGCGYRWYRTGVVACATLYTALISSLPGASLL